MFIIFPLVVYKIMVYLIIYGAFYLMIYSNYFCCDYFNADWIVFLPFSQSLQIYPMSFILVRISVVKRQFYTADDCLTTCSFLFISPLLTKFSLLLLAQRLPDSTQHIIVMMSVISKTISVSLVLFKAATLWLYMFFQMVKF